MQSVPVRRPSCSCPTQQKFRCRHERPRPPMDTQLIPSGASRKALQSTRKPPGKQQIENAKELMAAFNIHCIMEAIFNEEAVH